MKCKVGLTGALVLCMLRMYCVFAAVGFVCGAFSGDTLYSCVKLLTANRTVS